jgi:hypothetical protein
MEELSVSITPEAGMSVTWRATYRLSWGTDHDYFTSNTLRGACKQVTEALRKECWTSVGRWAGRGTNSTRTFVKR